MTEKQEKLNQLAKDILILSRNTLLVNLRFLDAALSRLELFPVDSSTLLTDGAYILLTLGMFCNPIRSPRRVMCGIICTW